MTNIIQSDFYRLRKGAALRNSIIGLLCVVVMILGIYTLTSSGAVGVMLESNTEAINDTDMINDINNMEQETTDIIENAAVFGKRMLSENFIPIFFLPIIVAVFCADYSAQTYRNTLSYESDRKKIYLSKLLLSVLCSEALIVITLVFSWLISGPFLGFSGFSGSYFAELAMIMLLQLPVHISLIAFTHCVASLTKSSGGTIAVFLIGLIAISMAVQLILLFFPNLEWIIVLDWLTMVKFLGQYKLLDSALIIASVAVSVVMAVGTTVIGLIRYSNTDFN